jgi:transposase
MNKNEQLTYRIIEDFRLGKISRKEAALILNVSEKTIQRRAKSIREKGLRGVKHGNNGRVPHNKIEDEIKAELVKIVKDKYYDFNLYHALEKLRDEGKTSVSYGTFYKWCISSGLGKGKKRRRANTARVVRERMANEGLMLQMDGSHHAWNGKDKWCLIACIDDATSKIPYGKFFKSETTVACLQVIKEIILLKGIPDVIYTDNAGWSGKGKRENFSQVKRACEDLGIRIITTSSPQSKGRIERAWKTFQDRLIPEMRLGEITTMPHANQYLQQVFLPEYWNKKNTVEPLNEMTRYKPVPDYIDLEKIFCLQFDRIVTSDSCFTYLGRRYKITDRKYGSLKGKTITLHKRENMSLEAYWGHIQLTIEKLRPIKYNWLKKPA